MDLFTARMEINFDFTFYKLYIYEDILLRISTIVLLIHWQHGGKKQKMQNVFTGKNEKFGMIGIRFISELGEPKKCQTSWGWAGPSSAQAGIRLYFNFL